MNRECIIYKITNLTTSQIYIGSSIDVKDRVRRHFKDLKANKHHSLKMQRSYNKYGKDVFKVEYLVSVPEQYRQKIEQWFLDNNECYFNNEKIVNKPSIYRIRSEEENEKSRLRMLKNEYWKLAHPMSEEGKKRVSESSKNRIWTDEMRKKLSESLKKSSHKRAPRKKHTESTKIKVSKNSHNKRVVIQYNLNGRALKVWSSITDIVNTLNFQQASISRCCQGKQKTSYGFVFKYF